MYIWKAKKIILQKTQAMKMTAAVWQYRNCVPYIALEIDSTDPRIQPDLVQ